MIQTYIRNQLASSCIVRPSLVGILGDTMQVPTWKPSWPSFPGTGFDGLIASDLPYALANNADLLPDLAIEQDACTEPLGRERRGCEDRCLRRLAAVLRRRLYSHATVTSYFQCGLDDGGQPCNPGNAPMVQHVLEAERDRA